MAGISPESCLVCRHGTEEDAAPWPLEIDMLAAHGARTTTSREAVKQLGKLANRVRHAAHAPDLDQLPDTASPPKADNLLLLLALPPTLLLSLLLLLLPLLLGI